MYIRPKRFFWFLVVLAAMLYAAAHFSVRSRWVRAQILRSLSVATGGTVTASDIRLTPGLSLSMENFAIDAPGAPGDASRRIFAARWIRLGRRCGGWRVLAVNASLCAWRGDDGLWIPSRATGADECPGACVFSRISPAFGNLFFEIDDASVVFDDCGRTVFYAGVTWTRRPVLIPGHPGAVQNVLSFLKGPVRSSEDAAIAVPGRDEWYEFGREIARFSVSAAIAPSRTAEVQASGKAPESVKTPEPVPEAVPALEATPAPEATPAAELSSAPEATPAADPSSAPEATPAPEAVPASDPAQDASPAAAESGAAPVAVADSGTEQKT